MNVDLVYLSDNPYGGWVTYTRHLHDALQMLGVGVRIIKVRENSSNTLRNFGYGLQYYTRNIDHYIGSHITPNAPDKRIALVVAVQKNWAAHAKDLAQYKRCVAVVHDHNEVKHYGGQLVPDRTIVIRKVNTRLVPGSTFILHPYVQQGEPGFSRKTVHARSVSRIDHDKNTTWLLDANRTLAKKYRIDIRGFENRIYTRFTVMPKYPEWVQSKAHFPRERDAAFRLLAPARYMVDMSSIKGDGGGSQYTFLEAIDAEAVCILHHSWTAIKGEMVTGKNCLSVESPADLAYILKSCKEEHRLQLASEARRLLTLHDPRKVAKQYVKFLEERCG